MIKTIMNVCVKFANDKDSNRANVELLVPKMLINSEIPIIFENIIAYIIAKYFRNALVRANYTNVEKGIYETTRYIELFLKNLIFNGNYELKNRYLHIRWNEKEDIE